MKFLQNVWGAVVNVAEAVKDKAMAVGATVLAGVVTMGQTAHVQAASLLPVAALDGVETDAIDTIKDIVAEMIPIVVGIMVAWSVITFVKKGFGKAGIK